MREETTMDYGGKTMKKLLSVLAVILMVLLSSAAFAKTPPGFYNLKDPAHIGLGGLKIGYNYMHCFLNPITTCMSTMVKQLNYRLLC